MKKKSIVLLMAATALFSMTTVVVAANSSSTIKAILDGSLKFKKDGKSWQPTDAKGNAQQPITYNGTTYLPLRATADALGVPVDYDASTKTISLGKIENSKQIDFFNKQIKLTNQSTTKFDDVIMKDKLVFGGKQYRGAYSFAAPPTEGYYLEFDLGAGYNTLHLVLSAEEDMKFTVFNGNHQQLSEVIEVPKGEVKEADVDLLANQDIIIGAQTSEYYDHYPMAYIIKDSYVTNDPIKQ